MIDMDSDQAKKVLFGIGIGILIVMALWIIEGYDSSAFGSLWNGIGLIALGVGIIVVAFWLMWE
jgi:hypothetical protein